jgi:PAS domain S-box-containing protein
MAVEKAELGIWEWDVQNRTVAYNDFFCRLMGYLPEEVNGSVDAYRQLIHPDDLPLLDNIKQHTPATGVFELEYRLRDKAGQYRWLYDRGQVTRWSADRKIMHASGITIEITRRKQIELAFRESEAINKAILGAMPDLKFRISAAGYFLDYFASREGGDQPLVPPEQFMGKHLSDVLPPYLAQAILQNLGVALRTQQTQHFEYPLFLDDVLHHYEARISAVNQEEAIAVVRDITELKRIQQELQDRLLELERKNLELEQYLSSNLQLEHFAHIVSHDLREPVRTVNSFARLMLHKYNDVLDEDGRLYLGFIASGAHDMHHLIESLLEYSRYSTQGQRHSEEIDLPELLRAVQAALHELIESQQATIEAPGLPAVITGHRTGLSQVFQNLISNAIKFRRPAAPPHIRIECHDEGDCWRFGLRDNGIGIEPQYHEQIFLLFRRLHSKRQYPGSGIGLALCRRIVEQHGGRIWVESEVGEGTVFWFTIGKKS